MAEAAFSQPFDTSDRVREMIENAPLPIPTYYAGLEREGDKIDAELHVRMLKAQDLKEKMDALAPEIYRLERAERKGGKSFRETREYDFENGGETVTRTPTGELEKLNAQYAALKAQRKEVIEKRRRRKWIEVVNEGIAGNGVRLVPNPDPIGGPFEGEGPVEWHAREWKTVEAARAALAAAQNAPATKDEAKARLDAFVDRMAAQGRPDLGGFTRGTSVAPRGGLQVGNPDAEIGWVQTFVGQSVFIPNFAKTMCWLFPDEIKKKFHALLDTYDFMNAIPAKDRASRLVSLEAELWEARRRCEAAYLACRVAGITNRNRPRDTPWQILLDVLPVAGRPRVNRPFAPAVIEVNDDIDFEGDADEGNDE